MFEARARNNHQKGLENSVLGGPDGNPLKEENGNVLSPLIQDPPIGLST